MKREAEENTMSILEMAKKNEDFRQVVRTGEKMQVVLMSIPEGGEIGAETHEGHDQVLIFVEGSGKARIGDAERAVGAGDLAFVPSGVHHDFINDGSGALKLYTMYAPPEHAPGTHHASRSDAEADEQDH